MVNPSSSSPDVPAAHEGAHYANPSSKPLERPGKTDRDGVQRLTWSLFFVLILCVVAGGLVLGLVQRH
jgi:hypothetical protein